MASYRRSAQAIGVGKVDGIQRQGRARLEGEVQFQHVPKPLLRVDVEALDFLAGGTQRQFSRPYGGGGR